MLRSYFLALALFVVGPAQAETANTPAAPLRELIQPYNLFPSRLPNLAGPQSACGAGAVSVKGAETRVTLTIDYSAHKIWNPDTQRYDDVNLRSYNHCLTGPTLTIHLRRRASGDAG